MEQMNKNGNFRILTIFFLIFTGFAYNFGYSHPGGLDANSGHYNRKTGEYHKHKKRSSQSPANVNPSRVEESSDAKVDNVRVVPQHQSIVRGPRRPELKLAGWNIRILSDGSRNDAELHEIAQTLIDYDFIAISELRDEKVLQRVQRILSESGAEYGYLMSDPVGKEGSRHKERYAFLYYKGLVSVVKGGEHYPDAADGKGDFVRDPYWATFRAGKFDFSVIVVHVVWGKSVGARKAEVKALGDVYGYVQAANGVEDDVLLVGDFNRNPTDADAYNRIMSIPSMTRLFQFPQKSHIRDSSLYDNIFFQTNYLNEYLNRSGIDKFDETDFANDDKAANLAVSDHRPVWAVFSISADDDGSGVSAGATVSVPVPESTEPEPEPSEDETVYVTRSGKKYHTGGCSSLRRSKIKISLAEAKQKYGPCSRCNPPR